MSKKLDEFQKFREKMNEAILSKDDLNIKRFFNLDTNVYRKNKLSSELKEMLGLVSSLVLRCDDCISYHIIQCKKEGWSNEEILEAMSVGLIVGGSIVIPHLRRAVNLLEELSLEKENNDNNKIVYKIYTDGACSGNPGPGGYGAVIIKDNKEEEVTGSAVNTTNNRMELKAVIEALKTIPEGAEVELHSDSTYVLNGLSAWMESWKSNGWKTSSNKEVANKDLWEELDFLISKLDIEYFKVEGHSGDHYNEVADSLAKNAIPKEK